MAKTQKFSPLDFVPTLDDDANVDALDSESEDDDDDEDQVKPKKRSRHMLESEFSSDFIFDQNDYWQKPENVPIPGMKSSNRGETLEEKIALHRQNLKRKNQNKKYDDNEEETMEVSDSDEDVTADTVKEKKRTKKVLPDEEKISYDEEAALPQGTSLFTDMALSRPLQRALTEMNVDTPTPIQAATIPVALAGRDVCACAATGTGKTLAFMLPILERLLFRARAAATTRVLVLSPTRELAVQIFQVARRLAEHTNITISLSAGGLDVKAQEAALRMRPDVVIATPGRLIDHVHNAPSFNLQDIEVLVLDEADRMLDEYFAEQMKEVIRLCARTRQTMLFSATMTEQVKDLAAVSLEKPVRVFVNENTDVAHGLRQEFIRVRESREGDREAIVAALLSRTFQTRVMVFTQTKAQAHRMHVQLGLLGLSVAELHGNLPQAQRLQNLQRFKDREVDVLLATDVAARGLDISGVATVINFTTPATVKHYVHRVGRTARAGRAGRAITLVGEKERHVLKELVKKARAPVKSRVLAPAVIAKYREKLDEVEEDVKQIMKEEKEESAARAAENQANKAQRLLTDGPVKPEDRRQWFQSARERRQEKDALRLETHSALQPGKKRKRNRGDEEFPEPTPADRAKFEQMKTQLMNARKAKKLNREARIRACSDDTSGRQKKVSKKSKKSFAKELTSTSDKSVRKMRAKVNTVNSRPKKKRR